MSANVPSPRETCAFYFKWTVIVLFACTLMFMLYLVFQENVCETLISVGVPLDTVQWENYTNESCVPRQNISPVSIILQPTVFSKDVLNKRTFDTPSCRPRHAVDMISPACQIYDMAEATFLGLSLTPFIALGLIYAYRALVTSNRSREMSYWRPTLVMDGIIIPGIAGWLVSLTFACAGIYFVENYMKFGEDGWIKLSAVILPLIAAFPATAYYGLVKDALRLTRGRRGFRTLEEENRDYLRRTRPGIEDNLAPEWDPEGTPNAFQDDSDDALEVVAKPKRKGTNKVKD